jgi:hypothetical protein
MTTISAVAKLIPNPPALVLNMNINFELPGRFLINYIYLCKKKY